MVTITGWHSHPTNHRYAAPARVSHGDTDPAVSVEPDVQAMVREDRLAARHDGTVDRAGRVVAHVPGPPPQPRPRREVAHPRGSGAPEERLDVVAPLLRDGAARVDRPVAGNRGEMRPGTRHDVDDLVAATAEGDPTALAELVGEPVDLVGGLALCVDGQGEMSQRVLGVSRPRAG